MDTALQIMIGVLAGIAVIGGVFWFTFRAPPDRRESSSVYDATTSSFDPPQGGGSDGQHW